jgi:hypothetical protein
MLRSTMSIYKIWKDVVGRGGNNGWIIRSVKCFERDSCIVISSVCVYVFIGICVRLFEVACVPSCYSCMKMMKSLSVPVPS